MRRSVLILAVGGFFFTICLAGTALAQDSKVLTRAFEFEGAKRTYFIRLPSDFRADRTYWPLVVVHGGGGGALTNTKAIAIRRLADQLNLPAIAISPEFESTDKKLSQFPVLGEADFLKEALKKVRAEFKTHPKMLLTGYSMGGQFAHRFALANPDLVQACAPFAAGTWSTPDGRLLMQGYGAVKNPKTFLSSQKNAEKFPKGLQGLFHPRTAEIAGLPAKEGAEEVPFLVMCGTLDPRCGIARGFAMSLQKAGFTVETRWPQTPHGSPLQKYKKEFEKYPKFAVLFFKRHTVAKSQGEISSQNARKAPKGKRKGPASKRR